MGYLHLKKKKPTINGEPPDDLQNPPQAVGHPMEYVGFLTSSHSVRNPTYKHLPTINGGPPNVRNPTYKQLATINGGPPNEIATSVRSSQ